MAQSEYTNICNVIYQNDLNPEIRDYFNSNLLTNQAVQLINKELNRTFDSDSICFKRTTISIPSIMELILDNELRIGSPEELLSKHLTTRMDTKKYWYRIITDESKGKMKNNPMHLKTECDQYFSLLRTNKELVTKENITREEFLLKRLNEIKKWKNEKEQLLISFPYVSYKTPLNRVKAFLIDLKVDIYSVIINEYNSSLEGYLQKFPAPLLEAPYFSYRSSQMEDLETELIGNTLNIYNTYEFEDGYIKTIVASHVANFDALSSVDRQKEIDKFMNQYQVDFSSMPLDMLDREICQVIFNNMTANIIKNKTLKFSLPVLAKQVYGDTRIRVSHLEDLRNRLHKLMEYNPEVFIKHKNSTIALHRISYTFFQKVQSYTKNLDGIIVLLEDIDKELYDETADEKTKRSIYYDMVVEIEPSNQLIETFTKEKYIEILSKKYREIKSRQTRAFLMVLQEERLDAFLNNNLTVQFDYIYFKNKMRLQGPPSEYIKIVKNNLKELVDSSSIISNFKIGASTITIDFTPLDDLEKGVYKVNVTPEEYVIDLKNNNEIEVLI